MDAAFLRLFFFTLGRGGGGRQLYCFRRKFLDPLRLKLGKV